MKELIRILLRIALFLPIYLHCSQVYQSMRSHAKATKQGISNKPIVLNESNKSNNKGSDSSSGKSLLDSCSNQQIDERFILYEVNPGEGFNLRRDIYIRLAPLIHSLNQDDPNNKTWTLVLPPWGRLPHWRKTKDLYPWSKFFDTESIKQYIPAIELHEYLQGQGKDNLIEVVYQLQHFPFDDTAPTIEWKEQIQTTSQCRDPLGYKLNEQTKLYSGYFWNKKILTKQADCMSLRGQASTLKDFLLNSSEKSIMFDRAEVILWDHYGGEEWWRARLSLRFSQHLIQSTERFLNANNLIKSDPKTSKINSLSYISVHLRRKDFLYGRQNRLPSLHGVASQISKLCQKLQVSNVFLATDADQSEISLLQTLLKEISTQQQLRLISFHHCRMTEGECAIIDQILCSYSAFFAGTEESTYTFRIFEEREILGFEPEVTYNYLCPDVIPPSTTTTIDNLNEPETNYGTGCKQPTRWKIPDNLLRRRKN